MKSRLVLLAAVLLAISTLLPDAARAASTPSAPGASGEPVSGSAALLASACFTCHGPDGRSSTAIPAIAGQKKDSFIETMKAFQAGQRAPTIMHQLAKGYTDADIAALADYFAAITP